MHSFPRPLMLLTLLMLGGLGCVIPIQLPRVTLTESFQQSFVFEERLDSLSQSAGKSELALILAELLGAKRVDQLLLTPEYDSLLINLLAEKVVAKGIIVMTLSLVPGEKPDSFYISGNGAYDVIDTSTSEVFFSARYHLQEKHYPISLIESNEPLPIYFDQVLINYLPYDADRKVLAHYPTEPVQIDAVIDHRILQATGKPIFSLDYQAQHRVSIKGKPIGYIQFNQPHNPFDRIIDLRGMRAGVKRDYTKRIQKALSEGP